MYHGNYYLTVQCTNSTCGAIYRAYRVIDPPTSNTNINHCMFCGDINPSISQDGDLDYLELLSRKYDRPTQEIEELLTLYGQLPSMGIHKTFDELAQRK